MLKFIRLIGGAFGVILAISLASFDGTAASLLEPTTASRLMLIAWIAAWGVAGFAIAPYITVMPARWIMRAVTDMSTEEFLAAVAGMLLGLLMGFLLGLPLTNLPAPAGLLLPVGVSIVLALGMMGLMVAKRDDLRSALLEVGFLRRDAGQAGVDDSPPVHLTYVDTSAIIDGRIVDVGRLGVPRRAPDRAALCAGRAATHRGRQSPGPAQSWSSGSRRPVGTPEGPPHRDRDQPGGRAGGISTIDAKLVALAQRREAAILTTDYNLNRVAQLQGVRVMNLNQLANALKPAFLPGEELRVKVIQEGKEPGQGVAFLDDGTMVVVEGAGEHIEGELDVTVTRILQTVAGRMIFAEMQSA